MLSYLIAELLVKRAPSRDRVLNDCYTVAAITEYWGGCRLWRLKLRILLGNLIYRLNDAETELTIIL